MKQKKTSRKKRVTFAMFLKRHGACQPAIDWVGNKSAKTAWEQCRFPYWMEWLVSKLRRTNKKSERKLVDRWLELFPKSSCKVPLCRPCSRRNDLTTKFIRKVYPDITEYLNK